MQLAPIVEKYRIPFEQCYQSNLLPSHRRAINAILRCRTQESGEMHYYCAPCESREILYHSCGHRSCPHCQNHESTRWLERQLEKRLPVEYFMVTFTLPEPLRDVVWRQQRLCYNLMFQAASRTLLEFGENPKHLGARIGFTAILHTHSRALDFHPHIHVVVPAGGVREHCGQPEWIKKGSRYLFNAKALARVFRGKLLALLIEQGVNTPDLPNRQWVAHCKSVGGGEQALQYLSRYLYRGVIGEHNILSEQDGQITYRYINSKSRREERATLPAEEFLWKIFQHILPKGFRRVRDYGLLHPNAKRLVHLVQLIFRVKQKRREQKGLPKVCCKICKQAMQLIAIQIKPIQKPPIQIIDCSGASP